MQPCAFFKCLSDSTRLSLVLLVSAQGELCVCEFAEALEESQPKISRHLAQLRACGLLCDRRRGQWVFYDLHPQLPAWCKSIIDETLRNNPATIATEQARLTAYNGGPDRSTLCC